VKGHKELDRQCQLTQRCLITNPLDRGLGQNCDFVVDTGATSIVISTKLAKRLKLKSVGSGEGVLADGRHVACDIAWVYVNVDGEGLLALASVMQDAEPLLGLDVLKMLQLQIDPARERLLKPLKPLKSFRLVRFFFKRGVIPSRTSSTKS